MWCSFCESAEIIWMAADHRWQLQEAWMWLNSVYIDSNVRKFIMCEFSANLCDTSSKSQHVIEPTRMHSHLCVPCCAVWWFLCVCVVSCVFALSLPAERHQPNPVSSTLITWFLHNGLAGWNESLCLAEEMPSCSESALIQLHCRKLHTLRFISVQITAAVRVTERAARTQWKHRFSKLWSESCCGSLFYLLAIWLNL